jgi:hypothetical protein
MDEAEIKREMALLHETCFALNAELLRISTYQQAADKVLATHLAKVAGVNWQDILREADELGRLLHDDVLLRVENKNPQAAALLDRRDEQDLPAEEGDGA